jgi:hypothetical protein
MKTYSKIMPLALAILALFVLVLSSVNAQSDTSYFEGYKFYDSDRLIDIEGAHSCTYKEMYRPSGELALFNAFCYNENLTLQCSFRIYVLDDDFETDFTVSRYSESPLSSERGPKTFFELPDLRISTSDIDVATRVGRELFAEAIMEKYCVPFLEQE